MDMDQDIESSARRKRARRAAASVSSAVKRLAAENKKVKFKFIEDGSVHSLPWTELLTMDETPFESIDDVTEGLNVMAPWYDDDSIGIQHAQAVILGQGRKKSCSSGGTKVKISEMNSESATSKGSALASTSAKSSTSKKTSPARQKLQRSPRRSPRKLIDKKAQKQSLQRTSPNLLEDFEKDNPTNTIETSQMISDETISHDPPTHATVPTSHSLNLPA